MTLFWRRKGGHTGIERPERDGWGLIFRDEKGARLETENLERDGRPYPCRNFHFLSFSTFFSPFFPFFSFSFIFIHFLSFTFIFFSFLFIFLFIFLIYFHYFSFFSNFFHFLNFSSVLVCVGNLWFCTCVCWHSLLLYLRVRKKCWHSLLLYFCVLALFASVLACEKKMLALFTSVLVCVGTLCFFTCVWEKKNIFHRISWPSIGPAARMRAAGPIEDLEFQ